MSRESPMTQTTNFPVLCALAAFIGLAGCASSPPTQFYSLAAVPAQSPTSQSDSARSRAAPLRVAAVHIPPSLDRREIVRLGAAERLEISGEHRWGAPFDEMVQQVLTQDLVTRLPPDEVVLPLGPAPAGTRSVVVDLLQFESDASGGVMLQGSWSLLVPGQSSPQLVREFRYDESASARSFEDEAAAMSRLLGRLADDIAREARARH
ncbi:MAG: PqiC family protein [Steroidobacteraceae bacterium]